MNELTQRGIAALKAGDREAARQWLGAAIRQDPADMQAWFWLSGAVDRDEERLDCLRQVLRLDPDNQTAARGIMQIVERNPHLRPKVTGMLTPRPAEPEQTPIPAEPAEAEEDLLNRAVQPITAQPAASEHHQPQSPASQTEVNQPAIAAPASTATAAQRANARLITPIPPRRPRPSYSNLRTIFRARPSLVPVILFFWLMVLSLYGLLIVLGDEIEQIFPSTVILAAVCGLIVIYMLIRLFTIRYELTTQHLKLPYRGKNVNVAIPSILTIETEQSTFQELLGTGDILLDAGINGVLSRLRIRNIPQVTQRAEQIRHLVHEQR